MKKFVKSLTAGLMTTVFMSTMAHAQESHFVTASVGADLVSGYIWRGSDCGGFSVQPGITLETKNGFSIGAWGSVGLDKEDTKEFDLSLGYAVDKFSVTVTDYWFDAYQSSTRYFLYDAHSTAHVFEGTLAYDFDLFSLSVNTNFAGSDYKSDGDRAYSTYIEAVVPFTVDHLDMALEVGGTPAEGAYSDGANIVNIGLSASHDVKISDQLSIPAFAKVIMNPYADKVYFVFGVSF